MTQAYLNGSTGRKSHREGRKSNTEGPHGGPQDEGPYRYQLDDDGEEQRLPTAAELRQIRRCVTCQSPTEINPGSVFGIVAFNSINTTV